MSLIDMNVEKIEVQRMSLSRLMTNIEQGTIRIPRFQRVFVWSRSKIIELLDSIYNEYPIGTIFLWEAPAEINHLLRTVDYLGQPSIAPNRQYSLILDGQQRLTSLYAVIKGLSIENDDYGRIVFDLEPTDPEKQFQYRKPNNKRWVAVKDVITNNYGVYDNLDSAEHRSRFHRCSQLLSNYPFSTVIVKDVELEQAIEIFERINRAGKRLTRYDLITAAVLTSDFDLRERTNQDIIEPLTESFGEIAETSIPQALALNIKGNTEHKTQMELEAPQVKSVWDNTVDCFKQAVDFVRLNLGVTRADFLPYDAMLPVLQYYFFESGSHAAPSRFHTEQLELWFWRTAFSERYSGASQTRMSEDAAWVRSLIDRNQAHEGIISTGVDTLMEASMRSTSAIRNAFLCLLNLQHPLHFLNGSPIHLSREHFSSFNALEKHHIFPIAFLERQRIPQARKLVHRLPNFCFIPMELNQWIADQPPSQYIGHIRAEIGEQNFYEVMASHLIPVDEDSGIWNDNFERFMRQRAELIAAKVRVVTGMPDTILPEYRNPVIDEVETALRDVIHEQLNEAFGWQYWNDRVPRDVQQRTEERIKTETRNKPGLSRDEFEDPRRKLDFCDVSDYPKIMNSLKLFKQRRDAN